MPRKVIPLITGEIYHVFNRGTEKRSIFLDEHDYVRFYQSLAFFNSLAPNNNFRLSKSRYNKQNELVEIIAYSLLPNHYHLLLRQVSDNGLSEYIKRVGGGYTGYFNEKYDHNGVLFQGKFKRVHVETDAQFRYLFAYINENHYVHSLKRDQNICYSSSYHYQKLLKSKLIATDQKYDYQSEEGIELAKSIYFKRKQQYTDLLE